MLSFQKSKMDLFSQGSCHNKCVFIMCFCWKDIWEQFDDKNNKKGILKISGHPLELFIKLVLITMMMLRTPQHTSCSYIVGNYEIINASHILPN